MTRGILTFLTCLVLTGLGACQPKPESTAKKLREEIQEYKNQPTTENRSRVESTLAQFDRELAAMEARVKEEANDAEAEEELRDLRRKRVEFMVDYQAAKLNQLVEDGKSAAKDLGNSLGAGLGEIGKAIKEATKGEKSPEPEE